MASHINASLLQTCLSGKEEIALLDVREAGQFGEGHLFFAVPLPYSRLETEVLRLVPRQDLRVVIVDDGAGNLAAIAAQRLEKLGYSQVSILQDGIKGWRAAGYTLFKGVNVPSKTFGELVEHAYGTPHISASELDAWRREGREFVLLDGRTAEEFHKMTIPGAVSCPNGELAYRIHALVDDDQTPVVINCAGRTRSILGAQTLRNLNLPNRIVALENGTQGWFLAGLELEHGSQNHYPSTITADLAQEKRAAQALAQRFAIPVLTDAQAQEWVNDTSRTTFVFDIRTKEEFKTNTLAGAHHAPGGQLIQATDQYVGVRNSRLILLDHEQVRAPVIASWLYQLGFEVAVLASGIHALVQLAPQKIAETSASSVLSEAPIALATTENLAAQLQQGRALLIDIRSSAAFKREHIAGAIWSIRPRLHDLFSSATTPERVILIADSAQLAALAVQDVREAGVNRVEWTEGLSVFKEAGFALINDDQTLADSERIDYLFFVHDRHDGNRIAAQGYLDWETALLAQCQHNELSAFRLPQ